MKQKTKSNSTNVSPKKLPSKTRKQRNGKTTHNVKINGNGINADDMPMFDVVAISHHDHALEYIIARRLTFKQFLDYRLENEKDNIEVKQMQPMGKEHTDEIRELFFEQIKRLSLTI